MKEFKPYFDKFDSIGPDRVKEKIAQGLYGERKKRAAHAWLRSHARCIEEKAEQVIVEQKTVNNYIIVADSPKWFRWILKRLPWTRSVALM